MLNNFEVIDRFKQVKYWIKIYSYLLIEHHYFICKGIIVQMARRVGQISGGTREGFHFILQTKTPLLPDICLSTIFQTYVTKIKTGKYFFFVREGFQEKTITKCQIEQ